MDRKLRLSLLFQAAGNAKNYLSGLRGDTDRTGRALTAAKDKVSALQNQVRQVGDFRVMQASLAKTRSDLSAAQTEARRLAQAHGAVEKPTKQLTRALEVARKKVRELKDQEKTRIQGLQDLRGKLNAAGVATTQLVSHEARLKRELGSANRELAEQSRRLAQVADRQRRLTAAQDRYQKTQSFASSAQGAGMSALGAGVAVGAPLYASGRSAMTFEDSMADIRKVVDFPTPIAFRDMGRDILTMSEEIPLASEGIANIIASAGQAGFAAGMPWAEARQELLGFASDAGKMGIAFDTTAEDAGQMMSTWRTAFRLNQVQVRDLSDQINYLGNTGPANALKISGVVTSIGALGEVAGMSSAEVAALGATVVGMGVDQDVAATGIKNTMLALTKGEAATKKQRVAFAALGLEAGAVARAMQVDAGGTIIDVLERVQKLSPDKQASTLTQLFGSESVAAIAPMLTNLDLLRSNLNKVGDASRYGGSMQAEFESRASTASNAVQLGWQSMKAVAVEFGTAFLPQIKAGAEWLNNLASGVRHFAEAHPNAIKVMGALVAVLSAALLLFGGLAMVVAGVLGPFALLQLTMTQTSLLFAPMIAGLTGTGAAAGGAAIGVNALLWPVLLVVGAIALLAAGAYLIYRNWGTIGPWLGKLWSGIRNTVGGAFSYLKNLFLTFTPLGIVIRNWGAITRFLGTLWTLAKEIVGLALDAMIYLIMNHSPLGFIIRNWGAITGFVGGLWTRVTGLFRAGVGAVRNAILSFGPLKAFVDVFQDVFNWFQNLPARFLKIGTDIAQGLINGIRGLRGRIREAGREAGRAAEGGTREETRTRSPSRAFMEIGHDLMSGLQLGIRARTGLTVNQMRAAAAAITAAGAMVSPSLAAALPLETTSGPRLSIAPASGADGGHAARARGGAGGQPSIGSLSITIVQRQGENMEALAQRIAEILASGDPGSFGDPPDDYGEAE